MLDVLYKTIKEKKDQSIFGKKSFHLFAHFK